MTVMSKKYKINDAMDTIGKSLTLITSPVSMDKHTQNTLRPLNTSHYLFFPKYYDRPICQYSNGTKFRFSEIISSILIFVRDHNKIE